MPGGCTIESRPIDLHLKVWKYKGQRLQQLVIETKAERLHGAHITDHSGAAQTS